MADSSSTTTSLAVHDFSPLSPAKSFTIACYVCAIVTLLTFGTFAVYMSKRHRSRDLDTFITARRSQPTLRVAWSFYASSIGCWAIFLPASYPSFGGWVSIVTYAVSTGLPLLLISEFGRKILKRTPDVMSLNDFAHRMYGKPVQIMVISLSLINMSVALISEYTAIGDLFEHYVGGPSRVYIILLVGIITAVYTASGGLLVSILTDQAQAVMSLLLIVVASGYLACNFREPLQQPLPENLGINYSGLSSIFSLPISLLSSAIYSDVFWSRVWAAEDKKSLRYGAILGFGLTTVVIAFFGFVGFLGLWAGLPALDPRGNLNFFVPFSDAVTKGSMGSLIVRVLLVVLATTMSESAVDSLQNAIVATLSSTSLFKDKPVSWSRILVFAINAPIIIVALQGYALLDLFLAMNILTTTSTFPLLSALWFPHVSGVTVLLSSATSLFCTCLLGIVSQGQGIRQGLKWTFTSQLNFYDYRIFIVAALTSVAATLMLWFFIDTRGEGFAYVGDNKEEDGGGVCEGGGECGGGVEGGRGRGEGGLREPFFMARCCCGRGSYSSFAADGKKKGKGEESGSVCVEKEKEGTVVVGVGGPEGGGREWGVDDSNHTVETQTPGNPEEEEEEGWEGGRREMQAQTQTQIQALSSPAGEGIQRLGGGGGRSVAAGGGGQENV